MNIRDAINIMIDAKDKKKDIIVERYNSDTQEWEQLRVSSIVNCTFGIVITAEPEES